MEILTQNSDNGEMSEVSTIISVEDFIKIHKTGNYSQNYYDYFQNNRELVFSTVSYLYNVKNDNTLEELYNVLKKSLYSLDYELVNKQEYFFDRIYRLKIKFLGEEVYYLKLKLSKGIKYSVLINSNEFSLEPTNNDLFQLIRAIKNDENFKMKISPDLHRPLDGFQISTNGRQLIFGNLEKMMFSGDLYQISIPINEYTKANIIHVLQELLNSMFEYSQNV